MFRLFPRASRSRVPPLAERPTSVSPATQPRPRRAWARRWRGCVYCRLRQSPSPAPSLPPDGVVTKYYYFNSQRVAVRRGGVLHYLHGDHLGSTSLATDASGAKVSRVLYYPYGETRYSEGALPTDYQYTGQRHETGFGLYDYNARYYDPLLGRFISADTVVPEPSEPQDLNRYAYVRNNPLRFVDPSGHIQDDCTRGDCGGKVGGPVGGSGGGSGPQLSPGGSRVWNNPEYELQLYFKSGDMPLGAADYYARTAHPWNTNWTTIAIQSARSTCGNCESVYGTGNDGGADPAGGGSGWPSSEVVPEEELPNFSRWKANDVELQPGDVAYRVHNDVPGSAAREYWTRVKPGGELGWRMDSAVRPEWGNQAEMLSTLTVPEGSTLPAGEGLAAYQGGFYVGGANQLYIPDVPLGWVQTVPSPFR